MVIPRSVISVDLLSGIVMVPGSRGHKISAALEDTRVAIVDDDLASSIQESIDVLDNSVDDAINKFTDGTLCDPQPDESTDEYIGDPDRYFGDLNSGHDLITAVPPAEVCTAGNSVPRTEVCTVGDSELDTVAVAHDQLNDTNVVD